MRFITIIILILLTKEAFCNPLRDISRNQPVCLAATLSADEMAAHPEQKTSAVWMMLYRAKDAQDPTIYMNLQLTVQGQVYRQGLICDRKSGSALHCAVECDGGQLELSSNDQAATNAFLLNQGIYINGACNSVDQPILLQPNAGNDSIFDLVETDCP